MDELKPCPFCGKSAMIFTWRNGRFGVRCIDRGCFAWWTGLEFYDKEDAVTAWNKRAFNDD